MDKRAISYAADHGGCGFWRIHWPESIINGQQAGNITNSTFMLTDTRYYQGIRSVKIQRQVTPPQLEFVKFLRETSNKGNKFKIYYEIDDVIFPEDIPLYNKARDAFVDPIIKKTALEIIKLCDYITSPTKFMGDYYTERTGVPNIVIPNYMPKFWIDRFYTKAKVVENYDLNKKRPRVGYVGSPTHLNVAKVDGVQDDIDPIVPLIRKTYKDYKWVFMGGLPYALTDLYRAGEIEYTPWTHLYEYSYAFDRLNLNVAIAPLQNNNFNLAKAPIKYLEAGALGIPCVCQNLEPYKIAPLKFNTPDEMMDVIKNLTKNRQFYLTESDKARKVASQYWLEDHIDEHVKVYFPS
jgi:glycosyltransferase involved in cell wall biosynthesis